MWKTNTARRLTVIASNTTFDYKKISERSPRLRNIVCDKKVPLKADKVKYLMSNISSGQETANLASVKVVDGVSVLVENAEAGALVVVLVRVPEDVDLVEGAAGNRPPESLGVLDGSDL